MKKILKTLKWNRNISSVRWKFNYSYSLFHSFKSISFRVRRRKSNAFLSLRPLFRDCFEVCPYFYISIIIGNEGVCAIRVFHGAILNFYKLRYCGFRAIYFNKIIYLIWQEEIFQLRHRMINNKRRPHPSHVAHCDTKIYENHSKCTS